MSTTAEQQEPGVNGRPDLAVEVGLLHSLIDNLPDRMYVKDSAGRYLLDNLPHARSLGASSSAEVAGKTSADFFPPDIARLYSADDEAVVHGGVPLINREEPITTRSGKRRWVLTTKAPLKDANGAVVGVVGISRDVTDRRRAERKNRKLRLFLHSIIENIPNMIVVQDAKELKFIRVNRAVEQLLGASREFMLGKSDIDLFSKEEAERFTATDRAVLLSGKSLDIPEELIVTAQGVRIFHTQKIPLGGSSGRPRFLLRISEDITDQKQSEQQLRDQNVQLANLARSEREASDALREAQAQLVQTEKLASLGQLVAGVAHEINNPLAFVTNNHAVLQRDMTILKDLLNMYGATADAIDAAKPEAMQSIRDIEERVDLPYLLQSIPELLSRSREGLRRIQQIVNDLRDFARHDDVAAQFEPGADLNPGVESTINIVRGRARKNSVELISEFGELPRITCQPARIHQVIMNLVANAIDACGPHGKVTVITRAAEGGIEILVSDTGSGIAPEIRAKIFDPFFTTKRLGDGTGLGLSISHGIINNHGGTIRVDSTVGVGSCFTVFLPKIPPRCQDTEAIPASAVSVAPVSTAASAPASAPA